MVNLKKNNFQYTFSVNGGDPKASIWGLILPFIVLTIGGGLYYTYANLWVPQEWLTYGWGVLAVTTLIFIISFVAFVLVVDTFVVQISEYVPFTEKYLDNLYQSIIDISLFFQNLIK